MAATDTEIANKARDSLARILDTDTEGWSQGELRQQQQQIDKLEMIITKFEGKAARSAGRRIFSPITRVDL